jgi:hypothetical protein
MERHETANAIATASTSAAPGHTGSWSSLHPALYAKSPMENVVPELSPRPIAAGTALAPDRVRDIPSAMIANHARVSVAGGPSAVGTILERVNTQSPRY